MKTKLYGKLKDGKIVKVSAWIEGVNLDDPNNEIYFYAQGKDKYFFGKRLVWSYGSDFIGFNKSKRKLRKVK